MQDDRQKRRLPGPQGTPLHRQLSTLLRAQILNRELAPGTPLPSEAQLQRRHGVSRSVVRQALAALDAEGLVVRGQGRPTVVAPARELHRVVQRMPGLSTQALSGGVHVNTRVLWLRAEPISERTSALGGPEVLSLRRVRSAAGHPLAVIDTWLPLPRCAGLTAEELVDASLHDTLRQRFGIVLVAGTRQVRATAADLPLQQLLEVEAGAPTLLLEGTTVDTLGRPTEVFRTWHRADKVVFYIDVVRDEPPARGAR